MQTFMIVRVYMYAQHVTRRMYECLIDDSEVQNDSEYSADSYW